MKILVAGESCVDIFVGCECSRISPESPVPIITPVSRNENPGMASNTLRNLLALGADAHLYTNTNWREITKTRYVEQKSNHMFVRVDENDKSYGRSDLRSIDFSNYEAVVISDYAKGFLTEAEIKYIAASHPLTFLDSKKPLGSWARNISFIKINKVEFERAKSNLSKDIVNKTIVTLGPDGALYKGMSYPVPKITTVDVAGAGDVFLSGLVVKYIETKDIEVAIKFANTCATYAVQQRGVTVINKEELNDE